MHESALQTPTSTLQQANLNSYLCNLRRHLFRFLQIRLVSQKHKPRTSLAHYQRTPMSLSTPTTGEYLGGDIVDQQHSIGASIIATNDSPKSLLSSRIPLLPRSHSKPIQSAIEQTCCPSQWSWTSTAMIPSWRTYKINANSTNIALRKASLLHSTTPHSIASGIP